MRALRGVIEVPPERAPVLSICLVLYGGGRLALDAIAAVVTHTSVPYEVIVVDNCSPDGSGALVRAGTRGVRFLGNRDNLGFGGAMNQAAIASRGSLLCLLNPDAIVTDGWAEPLVARVRRPGIGAVAPLLVEPGGVTVQEAGSFVDRSGFTFPIGTAVTGPLGPDALFARPTDYASAACLVIDRTAFEHVGGFDPRFHPAYFEDADLAFSLATRGRRTWFEPASRVVHVRGGTDVKGRALALVAANHPRFVEKWRDELARRPHHRTERDGLTLRDWRCASRLLILDTPDGTYGKVESVVGRWQLAVPDALVTVLSARPRPRHGFSCEWLDAGSSQDLAGLAGDRSGHYDAALPVGTIDDTSLRALQLLASPNAVLAPTVEPSAALLAGPNGEPRPDRYRWLS